MTEPQAKMVTPSKHERLVSLDMQRGLTIGLMVFADEIGDAYPHLNHSPWNTTTFADYVMPWFLFMVGTSMVSRGTCCLFTNDDLTVHSTDTFCRPFRSKNSNVTTKRRRKEPGSFSCGR